MGAVERPPEDACGEAESAGAQPDSARRVLPRAQRRSPLPAWLLVAVLVYALAYSALSIIRHDTFHSYTFDLGIMAQTIWNTSQGRLFETSIGRAGNTALIGSYLGNHVRPIILLLAPLYRLWPDPRLLLVLQSLALGLGAVPLYWVAHRLIGKREAEIVLVCAYLAYPALGYANLFDFHPQVLAVPLLFLAYWARLERKHGLFWAAVVLALSTKEELAVPLGTWGAIGLLLALARCRGERGQARPVACRGAWTNLALLVLAGAWAVLSIWVIVPLFNDRRPYRFLETWAHLKALVIPSVQEAHSGASRQCLAPFLLHLGLPLGYAPFLGPASLLVSLPSLVYLLVAGRAPMHSVGYHYPTVLVPWLFLATAEGLGWLSRRSQNLFQGAMLWLVLGTVLVYLPNNPISRYVLGSPYREDPHHLLFNPIARYALDGQFRRDPYHRQIEDAMALIPPDAGVATLNRFGAHLSHRRVLLPLEYPPPLRLDHLQMVDYVLLDLVDCRAVEAEEQRQAYAEIIGRVLATGDFRVAYRADRIVLLVRAPPSEEAGCVTLSNGGLPTCASGTACLHSELCRVAAAVAELATEEQPCWP